MAYEMTGKVKVIGDEQVFGSGFVKKEMVITEASNPKYPQDVSFDFVQDKASLPDAVEVGQEVTVTFDIRGREYDGRYFNNLQAWKLAATGASVAAPAEDVPPVGDEFDDDIEF
jgi:hypothetical protein